jgi:hypothetical protein
MKSLVVTAVLAVMLPAAAYADSAGTPSPAGAKVMILEPKNGAEVASPVAVKFGIEGMEVAPAGTDKPNAGHHHLIIDGKVDDMKAAIPADDAHKHFGKGQTEASVELKPGKHTLQLVLGDMNHVPHNPPVVSEVITITVK